MKIFTIVSAVPQEHYKNQKGFDVKISQKAKDGVLVESKIWMSEAQYNLAIFLQNNIFGILNNKNAEILLDLIEEFGQEKYCEGSNDEAMNDSEDI